MLFHNSRFYNQNIVFYLLPDIPYGLFLSGFPVSEVASFFEFSQVHASGDPHYHKHLIFYIYMLYVFSF